MPSILRRHPDLSSRDGEDGDHIDNGGDIIDPDLRLRTVRTAASTIAESIRSENRRERWRRTKSTLKSKNSAGRNLFAWKPQQPQQEPDPRDRPTTASAEHIKPQPTGKRRSIYVNVPLPASEIDSKGEPILRYARNKVRTSKYTPLTFLPKNLTEQFQRIANLYFLALVVLSAFPMFGSTAPQVAMLPLVFIITVTAVKDGIEDYRRASLDEQVNNSAVTKLGDWRNVNQPRDPRNFIQRLLRIGPIPGQITRGVRKLREKDGAEGNRIALTRESGPGIDYPGGTSMSSVDLTPRHTRDLSLDDIRSVGSTDTERLGPTGHSYPPTRSFPSLSAIVPDDNGNIRAAGSQYALSTRTRYSGGVMDWDRQATGTAHWERTLWKKLEVGDIVLLREDEQVPADIIVLSTSDATGLCYVETKNLDGETNLKPRRALKATSSIMSEEDLEHALFILDSEPPHANLYSFNGVIKYLSKPSIVNPTSSSATEKLEPVTINEMLLRGCAVRNTPWIIGLVAFTGADTKIMLNGGATPSKRSKIEKETNFNVIMNFVILIAMCLTAGIANAFYYSTKNTSGDFFEDGAAPSTIAVVDGIVTFGSALIAFQNIVPISLFISIEIVKTIQAYFISQDIDMYYGALDAPCIPKTWNISDDLGQIEYIFSDKTGTLTQNIMEFQKCSVQGIPYGDGVTEAMRGAAMREGKSQSMTPQEEDEHLRSLKEKMIQIMSRSFKNRYGQQDTLTFISPQLASDLTDHNSPQRKHLMSFFRALAVCHTVMADTPLPRERPFHVNYKAESPDEAALVGAARDVGFPFISRTNNAVDIEVLGQSESYIPLRVLEFNSTRKRMSVIVRNPEGKIVLYCKGADSVVYARLTSDHDEEVKEATTRDLEAFANGGLRTLCVAYRTLEEQEYLEWSRAYDVATTAVQDREVEVEKASELIEHNLTILGATALEDKLQEGVPEAIEILHRAGIKLWILTGDKVQTAVEIGFSCNLLKSTMEIMILAADTPEDARLQIEAGLNKIASMVGPDTNGRTKSIHSGGFAVVIDGDTLRYALDLSLKQLFLNLGTQCDTVVCCRVSPAQKALTVKLVKEGKNAMTLSIGDGANDVAMIQEANIGCGLFGLEGSQAAMSADYAFGQFRFLTKLLIVHGRWSYQRIADMHSNFFYKNVIWTFAMYWFLIFCNFDATYLYQVTFILLYNVVFTSLPVVILGAFDQDINAKASLAFPQLYQRGILGLEYTRTQFWIYMADGLYQSLIVFWVPYFAWTLGLAASHNGRGIDSLADFGTTVAVAAMFSANLFVGLNNRYWTILTWIGVIGSMLSSIIWIAIYSQFTSIDFINEINLLFPTINFWAAVWLSVVLAVGPRYLSKAISQIYFPLDKDIIREAWVAGDLKAQLGIRHRYQRTKGPEDANLFQTGHSAESHSEDGSRGGYEPIAHRSPLSRPMYSSTQLPEEQPFPGSESRPPSGALAASTSQSSYFSNYSPSDLPHISPPPIPYMHSLGSSTRPPSPLPDNQGRNPASYEMQNVTFAMTPPGHAAPLDDSHAEQVWYGYQQNDRPSSVYSNAPRAM